jgi:hypothetical protein
MPKRGDQIFAVPVDVADYIVHPTNLGTVRSRERSTLR